MLHPEQFPHFGTRGLEKSEKRSNLGGGRDRRNKEHDGEAVKYPWIFYSSALKRPAVRALFIEGLAVNPENAIDES